LASTLVLRRIKSLVGIQPQDVTVLKGRAMSVLSAINDAYLFIENGKIVSFGLDQDCKIESADEIIDCAGKLVLPAFCDSHTHLVFAAWRESEFVDRIRGLTYEEISKRGGGILNSAARLQLMSEDELFDHALIRLHDVTRMGTGAIEIKSGYGLTVESEIKMLRVIRRLKEQNVIPVKATFLGAHAMPLEYKSNRQGYIRLIIEKMLPQIADEGLADYIDVFCDQGFYTVEETDQILTAGTKFGLKAKIHANELAFSGGIQVGVKHKAVSVDHLEYTGEEEMKALSNSETIATILPSTAFFLGLPYSPARKMMEENMAIALASDYNPGTSPSGNLSFILSLAAIKLKMLPAEAINALTINGAAAMEMSGSHGSFTQSKAGSVLISKPVTGIDYLPYTYGQTWIDKVIIEGKVI